MNKKLATTKGVEAEIVDLVSADDRAGIARRHRVLRTPAYLKMIDGALLRARSVVKYGV